MRLCTFCLHFRHWKHLFLPARPYMLQPLITAAVLRRVLNIIREKKRLWIPRSFDIRRYRRHNHRRGVNGKLVAVDVERLELLMASQLSEPWNRRVEVRRSNWGREHVNVQATASVTPLIRPYLKSKFVSSIGKGIEGE